MAYRIKGLTNNCDGTAESMASTVIMCQNVYGEHLFHLLYLFCNQLIHMDGMRCLAVCIPSWLSFSQGCVLRG